ncbi:methyltransferase domain-containing protein [Actinoplanes sp. NPDC020271]|uniref:methyltransferase domain-containing protein n=1 Tax=Actinoplanes sp. NPDC020271 TaxID=3363896 RepID=UPI0037AAF235
MTHDAHHATTRDDMATMVALLDAAEQRPEAVTLRQHSYDLLHLRAGDTVIDVGAGTGRAVAELASRGVTAIGVDVSEAMVSLGRSRYPGADLRAGSAEQLPLGDGEAAGYRADKVFHELSDPAAALVEARRVLRPGGRIVLLGQDWDTIVIDADDGMLTRRIVQARADSVRRPRVARAYRTLLLDAGFDQVSMEVRTGVFTGEFMLPMLTGFAHAAVRAAAITPEQADTWLAEQRDRAAADRLLLALPIFVAAGTGPGRG